MQETTRDKKLTRLAKSVRRNGQLTLQLDSLKTIRFPQLDSLNSHVTAAEEGLLRVLRSEQLTFAQESYRKVKQGLCNANTAKARPHGRATLPSVPAARTRPIIHAPSPWRAHRYKQRAKDEAQHHAPHLAPPRNQRARRLRPPLPHAAIAPPARLPFRPAYTSPAASHGRPAFDSAGSAADDRGDHQHGTGVRNGGCCQQEVHKVRGQVQPS